MTNDVTVKTEKKRKFASLDKRKARSGWLFILPFVLGFALIYYPMIKQSIVLSFNSMSFDNGVLTETFVGWQNYEDAILVDTDFAETLVTGLGQLAFDIPAILIFSLFMAVLLNQKMAGRALFRAIFFVPVVLSTGIMEKISAADILNSYMSEADGIDDGSGASTADNLVSSMDMEKLFANMKAGTELVEYVTTAVNNIYGIVNRSGVQMLIFLAGLQSISPAIYESCKIDGATAWETFWKITFPMIGPMILVNGIYTIIDSFTTNSNKVMVYISSVYDQSFANRPLSSAMAWIYFLIVILIVAVIAAIFSAFVFYERKGE